MFGRDLGDRVSTGARDDVHAPDLGGRCRLAASRWRGMNVHAPRFGW